MTTTNQIRQQVADVLEYLQAAELALYTSGISVTPTRVTWQSFKSMESFLQRTKHSSLREYLRWLEAGNYSAVLRDGSLLQFTYDVHMGRIVGHRLAYVPCPVVIDQALVEEGHPLADIVALYERSTDIALRSPIRFDFDANAARAGHPAVHLTINSAECRIACAAPIHVKRFVDFIYRHFYPTFWEVHSPFFAEAGHLHIGEPTLTDADKGGIHVTWDTRATADGITRD